MNSKTRNWHSHLDQSMNLPEQVSATKKYQVSLPYTLLSISPSLAALHITRFRNIHPENAEILNCSHCEQCGTYLFDGQHSTLLVRQRKKKRPKSPSSFQRIYRRTCHACGFTVDTPISRSVGFQSRPLLVNDPEPGKVVTQVESHRSSKRDTPSIPKPTATPPPARQPSVESSSCNPKKGKMKATQTLKDMLERDRRREEAKKAHSINEKRGGLAAFLKDL